MKKLDLGCGKKKRDGFVGVDWSDRHNADVIHDLNNFPYPFDDSSIDLIYMDNVLEHLEKPVKVIEEIHRILKPAAEVIIIVPYFRSMWAFADPTHITFYTVNSFAYYDPTHIICKRYDYSNARFKVQSISFNQELKNSFFKKIIVKFANKFPNRYEYYLSHLLPLDDITFKLKKL